MADSAVRRDCEHPGARSRFDGVWVDVDGGEVLAQLTCGECRQSYVVPVRKDVARTYLNVARL